MTDCQPCTECPDAPAPVLPRCDVALPDGTYTNATVVVENGCITAVISGLAPLYQPTNCCDAGGGGTSGADGLDGQPGTAGAAATIAVGAVTTIAAGSPAVVTNSGSSSAAVFNFQIPRGPAGADGADPSGVTNSTAGIEFVDGSLRTLPVTWPPVMIFDASTIDTAGIALTFTKNPATGVVTPELDVAAFVTALNASIASQISTAVAGAVQFAYTPSVKAANFVAASTASFYTISAAGVTATLPTAAAAPGVPLIFRSPNAFTIAPTGGNTIGEVAGSYAGLANTTYMLVSDGVGDWALVAP